MGYYVSYEVDDVVIPARHVLDCLKAINKLHESDMAIHDGSGHHYSWVNNPPPGGFPSLQEALREWRWETTVDAETGDISILYYTGEKLGDDEEYLFPAIAPFVKPGGAIHARGEDGAVWMHNFDKGGKLANVAVHHVSDTQLLALCIPLRKAYKRKDAPPWVRKLIRGTLAGIMEIGITDRELDAAIQNQS